MKEPKFSCELCGKTYDLDTLIPFDDRLLQRSKNLPKTHIGTDSYVAVHLLEKQNALNFNSLRKVAEQVQGTEGAGAFRKKITSGWPVLSQSLDLVNTDFQYI